VDKLIQEELETKAKREKDIAELKKYWRKAQISAWAENAGVSLLFCELAKELYEKWCESRP
jgi:hypothetical protein